MGFFKNVFKSERDIAKKEIVEIPWHILNSEDGLDRLEKESETRLVVIFKHSTRCGISRMVLKNFEKNIDLPEEKVKLYFLDLLNHRKISQAIAHRFQVAHESPQLIALQNGKVIHHASHHGISATKLAEWV